MRRQHRFQALVAAFTTPLYRYALWLTKDLAEADDLVQETYCRAWRGLDRLSNENAAKAWLMRILRNEFLRSLENKLSYASEIDPETIADENGFKALTPETLILRRALMELSTELREPLILQVVHGYTLNEIAELLSIPANTAANRVFRARRHLRGILSDDYAESGSAQVSS